MHAAKHVSAGIAVKPTPAVRVPVRAVTAGLVRAPRTNAGAPRPRAVAPQRKSAAQNAVSFERS